MEIKRGRDVEENLKWEERRIKWKIRQAALRERAKGRRVRIGEVGMWVDEIW